MRASPKQVVETLMTLVKTETKNVDGVSRVIVKWTVIAIHIAKWTIIAIFIAKWTVIAILIAKWTVIAIFIEN